MHGTPIRILLSAVALLSLSTEGSAAGIPIDQKVIPGVTDKAPPADVAACGKSGPASIKCVAKIAIKLNKPELCFHFRAYAGALTNIKQCAKMFGARAENYFHCYRLKSLHDDFYEYYAGCMITVKTTFGGEPPKNPYPEPLPNDDSPPKGTTAPVTGAAAAPAQGGAPVAPTTTVPASAPVTIPAPANNTSTIPPPVPAPPPPPPSSLPPPIPPPIPPPPGVN